VDESVKSSPFDDPAALSDPYPLYRRLQENTPVYWDAPEDWWLLTRHEDVTLALRDQRFSAEVGTPSVDLLPAEERAGFTRLKVILGQLLLFIEAPVHTRIRQELQKAFAPRTVNRIADVLRGRARELAEECAGRSRVDMLHDFAEPLANAAFTEIMGVRPDELQLLQDISNGLIGALGGHASADRARRAQRSVDALTDVLRDHMAAEPTGVVAILADATAAGRLSEDEAVAAFAQLLTGSLDPTPQTIAAAVLLLMRNPDQRERATADPGLVAGAVEEALRLEPPFLLIHRVATQDATYGGRTIRSGDHVALMLGAANRDPEVFAEPDRFLVDRTPNRHLSFGVGHHFCLGGGVVRLLTEAAIEAWLPRLPAMALADEPLEYLPLMGIRKLTAGPFLEPAGVQNR
jgi:cytochrome P450